MVLDKPGSLININRLGGFHPTPTLWAREIDRLSGPVCLSNCHQQSSHPDLNHGQVTFQYYDHRDGHKFQGQLKQMTLSAVEFIGRFLAHVLPLRFVRIRHFGLHHGSCRKKLQQARRLLGLPMQLPVTLKLKLIEWLKQILQTETDPRICPACKQGILLPGRAFAPVSGWREQVLPLLGLFERWKFAAL